MKVMSGERFLMVSWSVMVVLMLLPLSIIGAVDGERPNIIVYIADDFGYGDSGAYGSKVVSTPEIDRLAEQGTMFTRVFAGSPSCNPSRSILYTGLMSSRNGAHPNHWSVKDGLKSISHYMEELGYHVAVVNKIHVSPESVFGFERVSAKMKQPEGGGISIDPQALDQWLINRAKKKDSRPLCLFLCDNNTHLVWPDKKHGKADQIVIPPYLPDSQHTRDSLARYYTEVELLDKRLGECMDVLERHHLMQESLFIFTADQGPALLHGKWNLYDLGIRVPFIARWPDMIGKGKTSDAMISFVDLLPTFVEIAGGNPDPNLDGRSALKALLNPEEKHRDFIYATHTGDGVMNNAPQRCIRTHRWKFIWNLYPDILYTTHLTKSAGLDRGSLWKKWEMERDSNPQIDQVMSHYQNRPEFELYDLNTDPLELNNLAEHFDYSDIRTQLHQKLENWMVSQGDQRMEMVEFLNLKKAGK